METKATFDVVHSPSPEQTQQIAQDLAKDLKGGEVVALFGELGSGKTTFIQGLAQGLGIKRRITSPTFIIIRPYEININNRPITFYHVDLYRLQSRQDLKSLGLEEITRPDSIVAIEWPEKIKSLPTKKRIDVVINIIDEKTRKIIITPHSYIKKAAQVLKTGGVVIFPTDTVYGIGCRWDFPKSVSRIYQIKGTPKTQTFPILVSSVEQAQKIAKISPAAQKLMDKYWPGALTIILSSRHRISKIGLRMPDSDLAQNLIVEIGVPIIGTSANLHGKPAVKTSKELDPELIKQVDYVLEGECESGVESTVVDATVNPPKILRQGAVTLKERSLLA